MKPKRKETREGGFPLAAVVLLVTTIAALLACIDMPTAREELQRMQWNASFYLGAGFIMAAGACFGGVLGWMQPRRPGSIFIGGGIAGLASLASVLLIAFPANLWQCLAAIAVVPLSSIVVRINAR